MKGLEDLIPLLVDVAETDEDQPALTTSESSDEEDAVPINSLKWKPCYKHAARKTTCPN